MATSSVSEPTERAANNASHISVRTFLTFLVVGGSATALQYLLIVVFLWADLFGLVIASTVGFVLSALFNYVANARFTFRSRHSPAQSLPKFAVTAGAGCLINALLLAIFTGLSAPAYIGQPLATGGVLL